MMSIIPLKFQKLIQGNILKVALIPAILPKSAINGYTWHCALPAPDCPA